MPQLDFSTYLSQLFWFAIFFFLLYLVLDNLVLTKVEIVIKRRYESINKAISNASSFCSIAEHEIRNQEQILQKTRLEALKIINDAVKKAELLESNMKNLLDTEVSEVLDLVDKEVEGYRIEVRSQLVEIIISIAAIYYEKLINSRIEDYSKLGVIADSLFKEGSS